MAQSEELKLHISATDGTEAALKSITHNFKREQAEIQRGVRRLSDGTKVWVEDIQKAADKHGVSFRAMVAHLNSTQAAANRAGQAAGGAGGMFTRLTSTLGPANAALLTMAGRFVSVTAAMEAARRGIVGYAQFDTQLRLTQNQTGMLASEVKGLSAEMKDLEIQTAISKEELLKMYNELREAGRFTPEQMKKIFPDVALALKGMGGDMAQASAALGHVFRNMSIPAEQFTTVLDAASHASKELQLDWGKMAPQMARVSEAAAAAGYKGAEGFQRVATMLGVVNEAFGDPARSATVLTSLLEKASSFEGIGRKLGFKSSKEYADWYKQQKDGLGSVLDLISQLENQDEIMEHFGVREAGAWRKLISTKDEFIPKLRAMQAAQGGAAAAGKNMAESLESSYTRLGQSLTQLLETLGALLDAIYVPQALTKIAEVLGTIADSMMKLIEGAKFLLGLGEWPTWMPKSFGEAAFNMQVGKTREGKRVMEYDEYLAGGDPAEAKKKYDEKMRLEDEAIESAKRKRTEDKGRERREELRSKGYRNVPREPEAGTTPAPGPLWQFRPPGSAPPSSAPPAVQEKIQKMSYAIEDTTNSLVHLASAIDERQGVLMRAGLYEHGAGPAGTGTTRTTGTATTAAATATPAAPYGPTGTGYGGSSDSRFLRASYTPSGAGFPGSGGGGGAGPPGSGGTGYGGGSRSTTPPDSEPPVTGPRRDQPAPEAPPAPGGGPTAPAPEAPPAPGGAPGAPEPEGVAGRLAADRAKFKAELDANPALREKVLRIAANEQGKHGLGTQAVIESMMNRASHRGRTLAQEARWTGPERGYYERGNMGRGALENPEHRAILERSLDATLAGGNVSDFATDNASQALAAKRKRNQEMEWTKDYGGELFFRPGRVSGSGNVQTHRTWMARMQRGGGTQTAALPPPAGPPAPAAPGAPPAPAGPPAPGGFPRTTGPAPYHPPHPGHTPGDAPPAVPGGLPGEGEFVREQQDRPGVQRRLPLQSEVRAYLESAGRETGLRADVYSGGQEKPFRNPRTGKWTSHRHDQGGAADLKLWDPVNRRYLDSSNPEDAARMEAYTAAAVKYGATGVGHGPGYMGTGSLHIGGGAKTSWGGASWIERARLAGMRARGPGGRAVAAPARPPAPPAPVAVAPPPAPPAPGAPAATPTPLPTGPTQHEAKVDLKVNDTQVQFARASMRRQADREVREARWNSYSDIGAA